MSIVVRIVGSGSKGVSFVSTCCVGLTGAVVRGGFLVCILLEVMMGLRVVNVVELDTPGSISSFGFIENPVRVEILTGAIVAASPVLSIISVTPIIAISSLQNFAQLNDKKIEIQHTIAMQAQFSSKIKIYDIIM